MSLRSTSLFLGALLVSAPTTATALVPLTPFPTPLTANSPAGSLIYGGSTTGTISVAGETNVFTLSLDSGQTITVNVVQDAFPAATLQPAVIVRDPSSNTIASTTAAAAGQEALIQTVAATTAGTYLFIVSGAGGTTGTYTLKITLNAALEVESHVGESNDSQSNAQDLNPALTPLAGAAARIAVLGHAEGGTSGPDYYSFTLVSDPTTIILTLAQSAAVTLELLDGSGVVLATGVTGPANVSLVIRNFVASIPGTYFARVAGTGATDYSLMVTRNTDFDFEGNGTFAGTQDLRHHAVFGAIGNVCMTDSDFYAFGVTAGDALHISTATPADGPGEFANTLSPGIRLYDPASNLIAVDNGSAPDGRNSIINFVASVSGIYRAEVRSGDGSTGEYVLTVTGNTGTPRPAFSPGTDGCGLLTAASPAHLWIGLKNSDDQGTRFDLKVELSKNGTVVASGLQRCITGVTRNPSLAKEAVVAFDAFSPVALASGDVLALNTPPGSGPMATTPSAPATTPRWACASTTTRPTGPRASTPRSRPTRARTITSTPTAPSAEAPRAPA